MKIDYKKIAEELIPIFEEAGQKSIDLYNKGLKIEIKEDGSPVSNGDLKVNEIISKKIKQLTPDIPIISEETVNIKEKNKNTVFWLIDHHTLFVFLTYFHTNQRVCIYLKVFALNFLNYKKNRLTTKRLIII